MSKEKKTEASHRKPKKEKGAGGRKAATPPVPAAQQVKMSGPGVVALNLHGSLDFTFVLDLGMRGIVTLLAQSSTPVRVYPISLPGRAAEDGAHLLALLPDTARALVLAGFAAGRQSVLDEQEVAEAKKKG